VRLPAVTARDGALANTNTNVAAPDGRLTRARLRVWDFGDKSRGWGGGDEEGGS
jgi:hypothetical protein